MTRKKKIILITIILVIFSSISAFITIFETNSTANESIKKLFIDEKHEKSVKKEKQDLIKIYQQDDKRCNPTQDKIDHRKEKDKVIYLSFDDGPRENTASISQILKNNGVTGTFFFTENSDNKNISNNKDVVRKVLKDGHMIGNHTYSHNYEKFYQDKNQVMPEINRNYDLLNDIAVKTIPNCKKLNHIFRFPGGSKNYFGTKSARDNIIKVLKKNKINWVDWDVFDYGMIHLDRTPKQQLEKIIEQQNKFEKQGKTHIVFITHDFLPYEEYLVDNYIKQMKERGYRFDIINNQENVWKNYDRH